MASGKSYGNDNQFGSRRKAYDKTTKTMRVLAPRSIRKTTKKHYMDDVEDFEIGHHIFGFSSDEIKDARKNLVLLSADIAKVQNDVKKMKESDSYTYLVEMKKSLEKELHELVVSKEEKTSDDQIRWQSMVENHDSIIRQLDTHEQQIRSWEATTVMLKNKVSTIEAKLDEIRLFREA